MGYEVSSGQVSSYLSLTNDFMYIFSGGVANETTVNSAGSVFLEEGGTANDTVVNESGSMNVAGTANRTELYGSGHWAPGRMTVLDGGIANSTTVNSGGSMGIDQGGSANATDVNDCGSMHVFNGGAASTTTVNSGGSVYIDEGGTVNVATVNSGGTLDVQKGGSATAIMENGGYVNVTDGANVTFVANSFKDLRLLNGSATLHSGTTATSTTVDDFGRLYICANGSADATTVNSGGNLYVSSGGTAGNTTVNERGNMSVDGGGVADTAIVNAGSMHVESGGTANKTTVNDLGCMFVFGTANETIVNGVDFGELYIYEGGVANRTTVNSGGNVIIDGTANSTAVQSDGYLGIAKGGKHTGTLTIAEGAVVSAYAGSVLDFDISNVAPESAVLVNDLSRIQGTPDYTLTVSGSQETGTYLLAGAAAGYDKTITVKNTDGAIIGTLKSGETVYIGSTTYTLGLTDDVLTVTVQAPTIVEPNGDVLLANAMPQARYMYGCAPTSVAMLLGYYDLYGYRGNDFSALIEGDVDLKSRGEGQDIFVMNDFESVLGRTTASEDYVYRFVSHDPIDVICSFNYVETTPADELEYSFVDTDEGPVIKTDGWNCIADYLGTGQFWRDNGNLNTTSFVLTLEQCLDDPQMLTVTDEATQTQRTIPVRYGDLLYGLYLYAQDKGYSLDMKITGNYGVDTAGGDFTFEDYRKEIDAGRPVLIIIEGHVMAGYGYNAETREIIFDNCYMANERMVWGGTYNYAHADRHMIAITTIGVMEADNDTDLALSPFDEEAGAAEKLILATSKDQLVSEDYCFVGSPLYLSYAVSNLGLSASGDFNVGIYLDGKLIERERAASLSLESEPIRRTHDVPLMAEPGVGIHTITVGIDPDNEIQETSARNNVENRSLMVLKEGTNIIQGTITVGTGEVSTDAYVMNGAEIQVLDGGIASGTLIQGKFKGNTPDGVIFNPGIVNVSSGGILRDAGVYEYGSLQLSGTAEGLCVYENGETVVFEGGIVSGVSVASGGTLELEAGGILTGRVRMDSQARVGFNEGAILNFDLTQAEAGAEALVNDLSIFQEATPIYTLTVDDTQADGTYSLADGAANFASTISVQNTAGDKLGTLTVGETVRIMGDDYTLNLNEGALSVSVVNDVTAPVITLSADTETVVLQTTLTATVDDGSKIEYRIGEFGLWKEYKEPIIASLNETYYFMAMDDAGNIGTNQITFANIDTSGVLLSTLWSQKGINPMGDNTTILYNEYTPLDPSVTPEAHCLTGCVNTASGQLIYYFIEKGWLDLPLTLKKNDEYTSKHKATEEGGDPIVIPIKADGTTPGTLSFAEINAMLSDFQLDSAEHAAALLYAIGVVLESKYSANSTGTSWNGAFFKRAGFEGGTMGGPYYGQYYWGDMDDEMQCTISDAGFEVLIENLEAGLPVGATYPGHALVVDGYDRESDRFHVNFGWGGNQATRWYTRDEIHELNFESFVYDLNPEYVETFTVTDARVYGTGTMIRAFEQADGMIGTNTVAFDPSIAGKTVELLNHITLFDEVVTVKDFNMNVLVTKSDGGERGYGFYAEHIDVFEPTDPVTALTFHASGGSLIVSTEKEFNYAFQMEEALSCTVDADGMLIYGGKTSEGTDAVAVLQALQTCRSENTEVSGDLLDPNGWSYNGSAGEDVFRLSNSSLAVGKVSLGGGDDVLSLTGHSRLYGNIDAGDGNDSITVDSTSSVSGDLAGTCNLNFVLSERDDHAMFTIQSSASGLCADATVTVDMKDAEIGTYTLISAASGTTGITDLRDLAVTVTGSGTPDFTLSVNGTSTSDYADLVFEDNSLKLQVKKEPVKPKWTYLVYMAADNDICYSAIYDIVSMQQASADSEIDIYVLADRTPAGTKGSGDLETINGTYRWDSDWEDTRVGKITYSPDLTVTVDWTSWGELDTGSIGTLERFVNWAQEESPAENYGLILWDHGGENGDLCWDLTTDPDWDACFTVSEVAGLLKEKGNIPIVIFNACLLGSELVATQLAGNTDVIVVSEPSSYGQSTFNYSMFFRTITPDMTPQEMAAIMVRNVEPQSEYTGEPSMLSAVDVTDSRLGDALEALAGAVAAGNDVDKDVLIHAMLQASQDGSAYDGTNVEQSDLGFMIRDVMADPDYGNTSEGFRKALADVKTALEAVVLEYRSVPAKRGSGIAVCNSVYTAKILMTSGLTLDAIRARISSYLTSTYDSNPLWGGLLNDLCATYLAEIEAGRVPTAVFSDSEVVVDGRTVTVSDLGGFSGRGELFDCIKLRDERFFGFAITAADKSTGSFTITNDAGAAITVSLLAADGTEVATGTGSVSFQDLAVGTYYLRIQSETDCRVTLSTDADWWTGVDRFEGNDSYETAAAMEEGYHTGLLTCEGDPDYYLIGNYDALLYTIEVYGEEGWTVGEYDPYDDFLYEADYADGKYTMMMGAMGYLLVEGTADLATGGDAYSVNVIPFESEWPDDVTLDDLVGTKDGVSWEPSVLMDKYFVEYSPDGFEHTMRIVTTGTAVDLLNLPAGTYQWRVTADSGKNPNWFYGEEIVSDDTTAAPNVFRSSSDANDDLFFATPVGTWSSHYCARHTGSVGDWSGTHEMISAAGKGRIQDLFFGSADPGTLYLTDSENGDALFLDDVFTGLPEEIEENTARLFRLRKIVAGAGDDIIDMTSQRFEYTGGALLISGGDGDDVIWANKAKNSLFGDAGNDRIVGASGDDVIVGGIGNDRMHGGGGDDIFTFCENWGTDTVEQLETGTVTLWFISGSLENWNEETLTYSDGQNSVTVSGVSADQVTLKFEYGGSRLFASLVNMGAFAESCTKKIFEDTDKGIIASVSI